MIIETSDNRFYEVVETGKPELAHCWYGLQIKRLRSGWALTAATSRKVNTHGISAAYELVRKAATRVVEA